MKRLGILAGTMAGHDLLLVLPRKCPTAKHACKVNIVHDTPLASGNIIQSAAGRSPTTSAMLLQPRHDST